MVVELIMQFGNAWIYLWSALYCFECLLLSLSSLYFVCGLSGCWLQFVVFVLKKINCSQHKVNIRDKTRIIGGSCSWPYWLLLTFCPKILEAVRDYEWYFVYECRFSSGDTQKFIWPFCTQKQWGCKNIFLEPTNALIPTHAWSPMQEPPCETITTCYFIKWLSGSVTAKTNRGHKVNGYSFDSCLDGQIFGRWELAVWYFSEVKLFPK